MLHTTDTTAPPVVLRCHLWGPPSGRKRALCSSSWQLLLPGTEDDNCYTSVTYAMQYPFSSHRLLHEFDHIKNIPVKTKDKHCFVRKLKKEHSSLKRVWMESNQNERMGYRGRGRSQKSCGIAAVRASTLLPPPQKAVTVAGNDIVDAVPYDPGHQHHH